MSQQSEVLLRYFPDAGEQEAFHADRYKVPYRAIFAGVGSGKTIAGVFEDVSWCLENNGIVGYVFEPTYKMVRRTLIPTLEHPKILGSPLDANPIVANFKRGDNCITFKNGSVLWFGSLEEPTMAEGPNIDFIHVDEAQYVRYFDQAWEVILRRLRGTGQFPPSRQGAWVTTTPPALLPGDRLYEFFEDPETRNPLSKVYRWGLWDNPHTSDRYKKEIVASHHGSLAKRFIEGKFAPAGTGSFDYDSQIHEVENTDRIHFNKIIYGVDFGWTNPSAIVAVGFDGDGRAYVLDEFYQNRTQMEVLISEAKLMRQQWGAGLFVCDRSEPQAIDSFRRAGLNAVADESKRDDGIHELGGRFQVSGDGRPRIYVRSTCVNWIHEVMVYSAEVKENDHAVDATRYAIMASKKYGSKNAWVFG
jgi:phage terminase large subunit-like protein